VIRMRLQTIKINDTGDRQFIGLKSVDDDRTLTIMIGYQEAKAIDRFVKEKRAQRPLTHDLASNLIEASGCRIERVDITELRGGTFYAMIRLERPDGSLAEVDARPSDAVALATALDAPIFVAEDVVASAASF
jgi:bifunctional DNase/RNase